MLDLKLFARQVCGPGAGWGVLSGLAGAAHWTALSLAALGLCHQAGWGGHRLPRARAMGALVLILAHAAWSLRPWHCTLNSIRNLTNLINPPQPEPCKSPEQGRLSIIHLRLNDLLGPAWE